MGVRIVAIHDGEGEFLAARERAAELPQYAHLTVAVLHRQRVRFTFHGRVSPTVIVPAVAAIMTC